MMSLFHSSVTRALLLSSLLLGLPMAAQENGGGANTGRKPDSSSAPIVQADKYLIGQNDSLAIDVWKEPEISKVVEVRPDGKISLPLVGELQAAGLTPLALQQTITAKLKAYLENPEVTVIVQEVRSKKFNVMGQIMRPGAYTLIEPMTVLDGLALAGGFRDFANEKKIYILRIQPNGTRSRIPFNYKRVIKGKDLQENVELMPGDTIVVP